jgi:hypothetical protein
VALTGERLTDLATRARAALAAELAAGEAIAVSEMARRAQDYRSWRLMRSYPERVQKLAHTVLAHEGSSTPLPDPEGFRELCLALAELLASLYEDAAARGQLPGSAGQPGQSGQ